MLDILFLIQDFTSTTFCGMDEDKAVMTNGVKNRMLRMNNLMIPWVLLLGQITTHTRLRAVQETRTSEVDTSKHVIYARVNMETQGMYVGETSNFEERVKQHYRATHVHSEIAEHPCKKCREHTKYMRHRGVRPAAWVTV